MNWGNGILLTIFLFVAFIMTLVVISVRQDDIHLVTENYYEKEIRYQEQIDREKSASGLTREVIQYDPAFKSIILDLPVGTKGSLQLFIPSDARLDKSMDIDVTAVGKTSVSLDMLKPGYWKIQLSWSEGGVDFYQEKKITL